MRQIKEYPLELKRQQTVTLPADVTVLTLAEKGGIPVLCMRGAVCEDRSVGDPVRLKDHTVEMVRGEDTFDTVIGNHIGTVCIGGVLYHFFMYYLNPALDRVHRLPGEQRK